MEEGRKSVLVAALSTYADLLAKNMSELDLGQGKGKGKASDDDVDLEAERLNQLNLCGQLIDEATSGKDNAPAHGKDDSSLSESPNREGFSRDRRASTANLRAKRTPLVPQYQYPVEEYADPFTGLPVMQETGFEPGPSNRPPQPIRTFSWKEAAPGSNASQHGSKAPAPLTRAASLPIERKPLPQPRSNEHRANNWSSRSMEMSPPYSYPDETTALFQSPSDLGKNRRVDEKSRAEAEAAPNPAHNGSYLSRISSLTSKALESAVNILGMNKSQPAYQDPPTRVRISVKVPNKSRDDIQFLRNSSHAAGGGQKRAESPPPAYNTLSHGSSFVPTTAVDHPRPTNNKVEPSKGTTNNSTLIDDEAFARSLQEEEYREIQKERDALLAHALANGTADDGDVELARFMEREFEELIAATGTTADGIQASEDSKAPLQFDMSQWDAETQQMQLDLLYALEIEEAFRAEELANDAGWAEAMRLQAEFDREEQNHEAWEEYKKRNFEECVVCGDENHKEDFLRPCEHGYCEGCLQEGFKNALASKTPLKCCKKNLSVDDCTGLEAGFVTKYQQLILELTTPNPMYCCNASCAKFLPPLAIVGEIGTCKDCKTQTCRHCRKPVHPGVFCEEDKETKAVKELAMQKGWKTCPGCNHLIERQSGCLHMTCSRCQTAFCYRCSKRWNDCESTCPDPISATHPKYPRR